MFRAFIPSDGLGRAARFDDVVEAADDAFRGQGKVHLDAQTFPIEVVQLVQQLKRGHPQADRP